MRPQQRDHHVKVEPGAFVQQAGGLVQRGLVVLGPEQLQTGQTVIVDTQQVGACSTVSLNASPISSSAHPEPPAAATAVESNIIRLAG